jgi:hypothetical protein
MIEPSRAKKIKVKPAKIMLVMTEIAEAGAAGDQVKVNVVARGGDRQRNAGEEDHQRRHQDRIDGVAGAPGHTDAGADGKVGQIGDAAQRGDRDDARSPAAEAQRGVT